VLTAERDEELVAGEHLACDPPDFVDERRHFTKREFHRGQRENAHAVNVGADFLIPQFHV
jgi:hypothetical protein